MIENLVGFIVAIKLNFPNKTEIWTIEYKNFALKYSIWNHLESAHWILFLQYLGTLFPGLLLVSKFWFILLKKPHFWSQAIPLHHGSRLVQVQVDGSCLILHWNTDSAVYLKSIKYRQMCERDSFAFIRCLNWFWIEFTSKNPPFLQCFHWKAYPSLSSYLQWKRSYNENFHVVAKFYKRGELGIFRYQKTTWTDD